MLIRFAPYRKHRKLVKERRRKIDDKPLFACDDCTFLDQIRRAGSARACWQGLNHRRKIAISSSAVSGVAVMTFWVITSAALRPWALI